MIISRTPFRVSFFGGGTDYPEWFDENVGYVLSSTIDKYCYITLRYLPPFFKHKFKVIYSKVETCADIHEIKHPAVREVLRFLEVDKGVEIHHDGDLPARSGLGSSSAFTVGLLQAVYALFGKIISKKRLAEECIFIERGCLKEVVGSQDQVAVSYGGINTISFLPGGEFIVNPVALSKDAIMEFNSHLMLFYTGIGRFASEIASSYVSDLKKKERRLCAMRDMVSEGLSILNGNAKLTDFGLLLDKAWKLKRGLGGGVTNNYIDEIYDSAISAGAIGGKITGAGGGGFLLLFAVPENHRAIRNRLNKLVHVPFKFEFSGSQIIFIDREYEY